MQSERISRENKPAISQEYGYFGYIKAPQRNINIYTDEKIPVFYNYNNDFYQETINNFLKSNPYIEEMIDQGIIELVISESATGKIHIAIVPTEGNL